MRVRCKVCSNSEGNVCKVKGNGVSLNKPRICALFELAPEKVKVVPKVEATYIPFHLRDRKAYKKYVQEEVMKQQSFANQNAAVNGVKTYSPDCLAGFRATSLPED